MKFGRAPTTADTRILISLLFRVGAHFAIPRDETVDSLFEAGARIVSQKRSRLGNIGVGDGNVTGLIRHSHDAGLLSQALLNGCDHRIEVHRVRVAEVENIERTSIVE